MGAAETYYYLHAFIALKMNTSSYIVPQISQLIEQGWNKPKPLFTIYVIIAAHH